MVFSSDALLGQHIIISGGAGAIGVGIVAALTQHGARVTINDLVTPLEAYKRLDAAGIDRTRIEYVRGDLTQPDQVSRFIEAARKRFDAIHTALCHAGIVQAAPILQVSEAEWDQHLAVNLKGAFLLAQAAARSMQADKVRGQLIFTSSWVASVPWPEIGAYSTSKAGMNQLMRTFARELAPEGIRANAIAPGIVGAGMAKRQWDTEPEYQARARRAIPLGELQTVESVADAFVFLCSAAARYMTGAVLTVDGGCSLYPMD